MFPVLASVLIFIAILSYNIKKYDQVQKKEMDEFWAKEAKANFVRRKSLEDLPYILIPDKLTEDADSANPLIKEPLDILIHLKSQRILNLTGISNTDLKLTYGTANITELTEYDQNYTMLARSLASIGEHYYKENNISRAKDYLEFAIETNTDVSSTYKILGQIYKEESNTEAINRLLDIARCLRSAMAPSIIRTLESFLA